MVTFNYLVWQLVKPSSLILLTALVGLVLWRWPLGRRCRSLAVVLTAAFGLVPLGAFLLGPLEAKFATPQPARVDGIIVLAGAELGPLTEFYDEPQLGAMGDRLTTFLMLAARYPQARLVYSGASDAATARQLLLGTGLDPQRIVFEDRSRNTCESASVARALVQPAPEHTWLLVSSAFHLPRAALCFEAAGWEVLPYPTDFRRWPNPFYFDLVANLEDLDLAAHEWLGLLYYRLRGWTGRLY